MDIIHITLNENWQKIKEHGFLVPKQELYPNPTGGDVDMVSAFYGINNDDIKALKALRLELSNHKNENPITPDFSEVEYVILEITCPKIDWILFPDEQNEMIGQYGNLPLDVFEKIGGYCKTYQSIPATCLKVIKL